ncbi:MAG: hypothetical protein CME06_10105 [Gemmatimonadetes bacterium]|nr:hypothetical protein [Gemmatimonadota bacterium]
MTRTLDSTVQRLRAKIEVDPSAPLHVLTVHSVGYRFQCGAAVPPSIIPERATTFVGREGHLARLGRLFDSEFAPSPTPGHLSTEPILSSGRSSRPTTLSASCRSSRTAIPVPTPVPL